MITGELKNKIDSLWDVFAAGGLVNPLDVIEQITYLMFIRDLDDSDNLRAKESAMLGLPYKSIFAGEVTIGERKVDGSQLKWSVFRDFPAGKMYSTMQEWVFPFIKNLDGKKTVLIPNIWMTLSLSFLPRSCFPKWLMLWMKSMHLWQKNRIRTFAEIHTNIFSIKLRNRVLTVSSVLRAILLK